MCGLCLAYVLLFWIGRGLPDWIHLDQPLVEHLELYVQHGTIRLTGYVSFIAWLRRVDKREAR